MCPNEAGTASETLKASHTAVSVLVIDDDDDIRLLIHELLEEEGYSVAAAANGREALDLLRTVTPCVILLDLTMPVMDGVQFRESQLQDGELAVIPTIVMTAHEPRSREGIFSLGRRMSRETARSRPIAASRRALLQGMTSEDA